MVMLQGIVSLKSHSQLVRLYAWITPRNVPVRVSPDLCWKNNLQARDVYYPHWRLWNKSIFQDNSQKRIIFVVSLSNKIDQINFMDALQAIA